MRKDNVAKFSEGERVRIRARDEISKVLDPLGKTDGFLMMGEMWNYCEKDLKILKVVQNVFDESQYKMFKVRRPAYILENSICSGEVKDFSMKCDRSCYFIWHEAWLEKD